MTNKWLASANCFFFDGLLRSALGTNKQNLFLLRGHLLNQSQGFIERRHSVLKVNNMDIVTCTEDVFTHLWVPVTGLVTEVDTGGQHIAHAYLWHFSIPTGLGLYIPR